jgi:hypothetical protein
MSKKPDKRSWLLGRWETSDEDSSVVFYITRQQGPKGKTVVHAFDKYDGENFRVTGIKWKGDSLSFETYVPSTKYHARQTLNPISRNRIKLELTLVENWKRTWTPVLFPGEIPTPKKSSKRSKE